MRCIRMRVGKVSSVDSFERRWTVAPTNRRHPSCSPRPSLRRGTRIASWAGRSSKSPTGSRWSRHGLLASTSAASRSSACHRWILSWPRRRGPRSPCGGGSTSDLVITIDASSCAMPMRRTGSSCGLLTDGDGGSWPCASRGDQIGIGGRCSRQSAARCARPSSTRWRRDPCRASAASIEERAPSASGRQRTTCDRSVPRPVGSSRSPTWKA